MLTAALQEQATWEQRRRSAKELLNEMLASRREAAELAKSYDTRCAPAAPGLKSHGPGLLAGACSGAEHAPACSWVYGVHLDIKLDCGPCGAGRGFGCVARQHM